MASNPPSRTRDDECASQLHTLACLVLAYLPLSVQAITVRALSKAWKQWAERAKERALEEAKSVERKFWTGSSSTSFLIYVPLWAAQQQRGLSDAKKRRFQLRAAACGDVGAVVLDGEARLVEKHRYRGARARARRAVRRVHEHLVERLRRDVVVRPDGRAHVAADEPEHLALGHAALVAGIHRRPVQHVLDVGEHDEPHFLRAQTRETANAKTKNRILEREKGAKWRRD